MATDRKVDLDPARGPGRECRLVAACPDGRASVYSLALPAEPGLNRLLAAAEDLLAATGNAVALCPVYGHPR